MKKTKAKGKFNKGITLVALVITILIMLILAGVTIASLTGDDGIIQRSGNAKTETEIEEEKEIINLAMIEAMKKSRYENITKENLDEQLDKSLGNNNYQTKETEQSIKVTLNESGRMYLIDSTGNLNLIANRKGLKVGDYVKYTYDEVDSNYLLEGKYTGLTEKDASGNQIYKDQSINQNQDLSWQVFSINEDTGEVLLICSTSVKGNIQFQGAIGYNNCVYLLNDICKKQYSNESLGIKARSINIKDIKKVVNDIGKQKIDNTFINSTAIGRYNTNLYYPDVYQYESGAGIDKEEVLKVGLDNNETYEGYSNGLTTNSYNNASNRLSTIKKCLYEGNPATWCKTDKYTDGTTNPVYNLIFNNRYYLATRCNALNAGGYAEWGIQFITTSPLISYNSIFSSNGTESIMSNIIRPVVKLDSNIIIDLDSGDGTSSEKAYQLIKR